MYVLGNVALYLGLGLSIYALIANIIGIRKKDHKWLESARSGVLAIAFVASIATFLLLYLLATSQFQYKYVAQYTNELLPLIYKISAFWAGNAGSLLLWAFLLAIYTAMVAGFKKRHTNMTPYVSAILLTNLVFFFAVILLTANPFEMTTTIPTDGNGLNPQLQSVGMIVHPVTIYMGYVGLAVPFAYAIAALIMKRMDSDWIKLTRRWTIVAWLFLTLGNMLGGWWAYLELGWGGYWAWDPVENASFLPWLTVSAFLHSVMIQERKGMLRVWNLSLIVISYLLTLFGTFLVRSGVLTSVHAFGEADLGNYFLIFMAFMMLFSIYVVATRYQLIRKESQPIESYFSKESSFLLNNLILLAGTFIVFWGTMYPLISEFFTGTKVNVGPPYFNKVMAPIFLGLVVLMALCAVIPWHRAGFNRFVKSLTVPFVVAVLFAITLVVLGVKGIYAIIGLSAAVLMFTTHILEFVRGVRARRKATKENIFTALARLTYKNRRRYGGFIVHIGIAIVAIGVVASHAYPEEIMKTISKGEHITIGDYELTFEGLSERESRGNGIVYGNISVNYKGKDAGKIKPEKIFYATWPEPSTEIAIKSNWREDLYVVLNSWESEDKATFLVKVNPFVNWIWAGGFIMVIGTAIALIGGRVNVLQLRNTETARV